MLSDSISVCPESWYLSCYIKVGREKDALQCMLRVGIMVGMSCNNVSNPHVYVAVLSMVAFISCGRQGIH